MTIEKKISQRELQNKVKQTAENEQSKERRTEVEFINQFYSLDLDAYQLAKITRAIVREALSKTRGKDRQTIIADIQKLIKQYRGSNGI